MTESEIRNEALEEAARVAENACLMPPDGGSPTAAEYSTAMEAAARIRALKSTPALAAGEVTDAQIEAIARAICKVDFDPDTNWADKGCEYYPAWRDYVDHARAALLAHIAAQPPCNGWRDRAQLAYEICIGLRDEDKPESWSIDYADGHKAGCADCAAVIFNELHPMPSALPNPPAQGTGAK